MLQKLKVLKTALIRRDIASVISVCKQSTFSKQRATGAYSPLTNLKRSKRLHGEELGCPQLKVEAKTVEESPNQHHVTGSQPEDGDAEGAQ